MREDGRMSTAIDTFRTFVDALQADLEADDDERALRGTALASRAFLSRWHFDRLISSAAGEPPAAFRRRVLLERAAYRLVTRAAGILDIGLEAGYASNEAFTRAFRRAYGVSPSAWRA